MPFDLKKSLSDWKSAKPLLLTKTGVSELLRDLPTTDPTKRPEFQVAIRDCEKIKTDLEAISNSNRLKSEKKARAGISVLTLRISAYVADLNARFTTLTQTQIKVVNELNTIAREGGEFYQLYQGDKLKVQDVTAYAGRLQTQSKSIYDLALKAKISQNWLTGFHNFSQTLTAPFNSTIVPAMRTLAAGRLGGHTTLPGISEAMADLHAKTSKIADHLEEPVPFTY